MKDKQWFWPPGLEKVRKKFKHFYARSFRGRDKRRPVLIHGPQGVGKTAFLDELEKLFMADNPKATVHRLNIAAFPETLIEAELFGSMPGAYTGAPKKERPGHIDGAGNGGILILEEIGELPKHIQAKLLTLVEDGIFYRLGGTKPMHADVQIVGTTNALDKLRDDFRDRFLLFKVPGIHERREDILHYFYHFAPNIFNSMGKNDALVLLAYNWPGNTRQIETYVETLEWEKGYREENAQIGEGEGAYPFVTVFLREYPLESTYYRDLIIYPDEKRANPEQRKFNKELKKYGLDLAADHEFSEIVNGAYLLFEEAEGWIKKKVDPKRINAKFDRAYEGLKYYCKMTGYDIRANKNLIIKKKAPEGSEKELDIYSMKEKDLLRMYYKGLVARHGSVSAAARWLGIPRSTLDSRMISIDEISLR